LATTVGHKDYEIMHGMHLSVVCISLEFGASLCYSYVMIHWQGTVLPFVLLSACVIHVKLDTDLFLLV